MTKGYKYVVDMDLEKYFDTVNQSRLIQLLSEMIKDGRVISLIHKFLRVGIMVDGMLVYGEYFFDIISKLRYYIGIMIWRC